MNGLFPWLPQDAAVFALRDFPRGGRVLRMDDPVAAIHGLYYFNPAGELVLMDPKFYVVNKDRIILGLDCWPRVAIHRRLSSVVIHYEPRKD